MAMSHRARTRARFGPGSGDATPLHSHTRALSPHIQIRVDEVRAEVDHVNAADAHLLSQAFEDELQRVISERGIPPTIDVPVDRARVSGHSAIPAVATAPEHGRGLAVAVYDALARRRDATPHRQSERVTSERG
jgi:hypothetical protein